jgi:hypothetical protein
MSLRKTVCLWGVVAAVAAWGSQGFAQGQDAAKLAKLNKVLECETGLANNAASYMIIDLEGGAVLLKARGLILKSWAIKGSRTWGKPVAIKEYKLLGKSALSKPERKNITPGKEDPKKAKEKKDSNELEVLELKDMPVHFTLSFGDDIRISFRPKRSRFWPSVLNIGKNISWFAYLPLKTLWLSLKHRSFTEIEVVMPDEKEAQGVYWSFLEGHRTIIVSPS